VPIVTSDNPRSEQPLAIIAEIEAGLKNGGCARVKEPVSGGGYLVEPDRRAAIKLGMEIASTGDTVVVAGKGHENYQLLGSRVIHFDDREVVREIADELSARAK